MSKKIWIFAALIFAIVGFLATKNLIKKAPSEALVSAEKVSEDTYWTCPMHPQVHQNHPGECPICHMKLVKVTKKIEQKKEGEKRASVSATESQFMLLGAQKQEVETMDLRAIIPVSGRIISRSQVAFQVYEKDLSYIRPGLSFKGAGNIHSEEEISGVVTTVDSIVDPTSRTVRVVGAIRKGLSGLLSESSFRGEIVLVLKDRVAIPESAVLHTGSGDLVYLVNKDNSLTAKRVRLGLKTEGFYEVRVGLNPGDVISSGPNFLIDSEAKIRGANDKRVIEFSAHNRFLVILMTTVFALVGAYSLKRMPLDAIPDLSDTQVIIYSKWDRSPDIMENQVTYPVVSAMLGAPKVKSVRGFSDYGFSYVYVIFEDGTDLYWARSRVLENLNRITSQIPEGVKTEIGPDATSVGWVYQYVLRDESGRFNSADLRSLQDWLIRFQLQSVQGVAEVAPVGGFVKQYQVKIDPTKLQLFEVTMEQVLQAVKNSNQESGGRTIEFSGTEAMVRSRGLVDKVEDIEDAVVAYNPRSRAPILVKQVSTVSVGPEMRRGITDFNGLGDTVGGIIVMRQGEDAPEVIGRVKRKIQEIEKSLPEGVKIISVYDRSDLIERAIGTLKHTLTEELIVVSLIILLFLWHIPSALVPIITIPISVLLAFIPMYLMGMSSNIMSLAGIAISIGVLVDGAIVEVENAYRKIQLWDEGGRKGDFFKVRLEALTEVGPAVFFSLLVIAVAFIPIFTLVDQEGRLFRPLALSKNITMAIAAILAITLDPAMRMLFARVNPFTFSKPWLNQIANAIFVGKYYSEHKHPISRRLFRIYEPVLDWVLNHKKKTLALAFAGTLSIIPGFMMLGSEFMPTLHEGSLLYMPTALPGISVSEAQRVLTVQDQILKSFPEVDTVFGKAGRAETSTDTAPLSMVETTITLKPKSEWRKVKRWYSFLPEPVKAPFQRVWPETIGEDQLIEDMNEKLNFLGMPNIWTMPIKNRIDMLSTGIRSPVGIKIFGDDLKTIQAIGADIERELKTLPGTRSVIAERIASGYFLDVDFDREKLKSYGLSLKDAQDQAMRLIGGENVSQILATRERYPIQVRAAPAFRQDAGAIGRLLITSPTGAQIPLSAVAKVHFREGPSMIRNENAQLVGYVYVDIDPKVIDIGSYVEKGKAHLDQKVKVPSGIVTTWSGQFENMERVKERLKVVVPFTLILILFLLYFNTKSWVKTGIVLLAVPFSLIGAVWFLVLLDYNLSIAAWVGMIALLGLDAETGVFMLMYLDLAFDDRVKRGKMKSLSDLKAAVVEGAVHRIRPKLMTVSTLFVGLTPIMWSVGAGADVMKRIAAPMIGGLITSFLLELLIYPVVFYLWKQKSYFNNPTTKPEEA